MDDPWKEKLDPETYHVMRERGTEAPFTGAYLDMHEAGTYRCRACGAALFSSETKFDSGSGWPSFTDPLVAEHIGTREDTSHGMTRTEVFCRNCGGHLGHLFNDGPMEAGGKRYCVNSVALSFEANRQSPGAKAAED